MAGDVMFGDIDVETCDCSDIGAVEDLHQSPSPVDVMEAVANFVLSAP